MQFIEPHAHMVSRSTDDYLALAAAGCQAVCEPAFWAGFDRSSTAGFVDYYRQLTDYEPKRAQKFGLQHYCWLCINPKEAEDVGFAREVIAEIPAFLGCENVLGIGEIGLNKNSKNELLIFEEQLALAKQHRQLVLIHTPHLEDKLKGTKLTLDLLKNMQIDPNTVIIDHVEEHTIEMVLDAGFMAGMTLYPDTKCSCARCVDMFAAYADERLWINSACDWGVSQPLSIPYARMEMQARGFSRSHIHRLLWEQPCAFLAQSKNFKLNPQAIS